MNRRYTGDSYLDLVRRLKDAMPDLALTTDIIVGFPGETDIDFDQTLRVVREARFDQAFTFIYSPREGTPAADMSSRVPKDVTQPRFDRLVEQVQSLALEKNLRLVGSRQRVLVEGPSRRDSAMMVGRTGANKVVHAAVKDEATARAMAGRFVDVMIDDAQTWFLMGTLNPEPDPPVPTRSS
jgi:tRNA-2-methylthio-N6-dimethylallyladenosine synthase